MSLQEQQNFLARLFTDQEYRSSFVANPVRVGREAGLSPDEIEQMSSVSGKEIDVFSESLFWKRVNEVEKLLPLTVRFLQNDFQTQFRNFCSALKAGTADKHRTDAIEFTEYLAGNAEISVATREAARFEGRKLEFFLGRRRSLLFTARYRTGEGLPIRERAFGVWLNIRGRVRRFGG